MRRLAPNHISFGVLLAFFLMPLSGLGTDIYLPSLPALSNAMQASASQIQFSLTLFLMGYALGQFFIGTVLDSFGRWRLGCIALFLFGLSSLCIAFAPNLLWLYALRLIQGLTGAVIAVAKRAFFVDVFEGERLLRYLSSFTIIWSLGPIVAPFIGGFLQTSFGWQASFVFLALYAWSALAMELWRGGETLPQAQPFAWREIMLRYRFLLTQIPFVRGLLNVALPYCCVLAFSMTSPFIIERVYGYSPRVTGYAALLMGLAWMTGGILARWQIARPALHKHAFATAGMVLGALLMLGVSLHHSQLATLLIFAFCVHACCGLVFTTYFAQCHSLFPQYAGLAGGLVGGVAFMLTAALSYAAVSLLHVDSQFLLAATYLIFACGMVGTWLWERYGNASAPPKRHT